MLWAPLSWRELISPKYLSNIGKKEALMNKWGSYTFRTWKIFEAKDLWAFHPIFVTWFLVVLGDQVTKKLIYFFLMSKARQAKMEHIEMKISQPIFGILVVLTTDNSLPVLLSCWNHGDKYAKYILEWNNFFKKEPNLSFVSAKIQQNCTGTGNYNSKATRQGIICGNRDCRVFNSGKK